jgi:hypothetical protein
MYYVCCCRCFQVTEVTQLLPYFEGRMVPLCDQPLQDQQQVSSQVEQLAQTVRVSTRQRCAAATVMRD